MYKISILIILLLLNGCSSSVKPHKRSSLSKSFKTRKKSHFSKPLRKKNYISLERVSNVFNNLSKSEGTHLEDISNIETHLEDISNIKDAPKIRLSMDTTKRVSPPVIHLNRLRKIETPPTITVENVLYTPIESGVTDDSIELKAKEFLGTKYVWGATGPNKFDCSGFTQCVYNSMGVHIPRVSKNQAKVGEYISYSELKKGDLVFFDGGRKPKNRVSHVGIYLGENNFIHASSKAKKIIISNFNRERFYKKRFLWGRRVLENPLYLSNNESLEE